MHLIILAYPDRLQQNTLPLALALFFYRIISNLLQVWAPQRLLMKKPFLQTTISTKIATQQEVNEIIVHNN